MKLSLFSVRYAGYGGQHQRDLAGFIGQAAGLGFDAVMLAGKRPHLSPLDIDDASLEALKATLSVHNIECGVIAGYTDLSPSAAAEVPYLELQIAYVESLAWLARELGASVVRVFTAYEVAGTTPLSVWTGAVRALQEMADLADQFDVTLAIQNHHDIAVHSDALLELLHDIDRPNCRLGFDAWSPALRGEDLYESARTMAPYTAITTNADYVRLPRFRYQPDLVNYERAAPDMVRAVPFGEGFIDYEAFFRGLSDGGFTGIATYEMCSPVRGGGDEENLDRYCKQYLEWMTGHGYAE